MSDDAEDLRAGDRVAPAPHRVDRYPPGARGTVRLVKWTDEPVEAPRVDVEWDHQNEKTTKTPRPFGGLTVESLPTWAVRKLGLIERIGEIETT